MRRPPDASRNPITCRQTEPPYAPPTRPPRKSLPPHQPRPDRDDFRTTRRHHQRHVRLMVCALDYAPARVTVVIDKENYTRHLIEQSGWFGVQIPFAAQAETVITMGESRKDNPDKLRAVSLLPRRATTCRWSPTVPPGSSAASCRSRITRKPTTSLLAKSPPPGRTTASSVTAIGILTTSVTT